MMTVTMLTYPSFTKYKISANESAGQMYSDTIAALNKSRRMAVVFNG